jgi:type II secretory pathway component HofQ
MIRYGFSVLIILGFFSGCMSLDLKGSDGLKAILDAYKKENSSREQKEGVRNRRGIKQLSIIKSGMDLLVTLDVEQASLPVVVKRILDESKMAFQMGDIVLKGHITSRFEKKPVVSSLKLLLSSNGYSCELKNGVLIFGDLYIVTEPPDPKALTQPIASVQKGIPIDFLDADSINSILDSLYPVLLNKGFRRGGINFAFNSNRGMLYVSGPSNAVQSVIKTVRLADRDQKHVVIEAMVVEFDSDAFEKLGADLSSAAGGEISSLATGFGSLSSNAITFKQTNNLKSTATFTAAVDFLVSQDKAELITRPYLATLSGKPAQVHITRDRYVVVQESTQGASITTSTPISSGVMMKVTPFVRPGGQIRLDFEVEDSSFIATTGNVIVEVDKNHAVTSMMVGNSQSIIIGGLVLHKESVSNSGIPWVRHIPGLNWLFSKQERDLDRREVMIYLTPTIWEPELNVPLIEPDALTSPEGEGKLSPLEQLE